MSKKPFSEKFHRMLTSPAEYADDCLTPVLFSYTKTHCLGFNDMIGQIPQKNVNISLDFAYQMAVGKFHRGLRTGGSEDRTPMKIFLDAASGKLGEFALVNFLINNGDGWLMSEPDVKIYERGIWDNGDGVVSKNDISLKVAIKTVKHFSNLMLLETGDWDVDESGKAFYSPGWKRKKEKGMEIITPEYPDLIILAKIQQTPRSLFEDSGAISREDPTSKDLEFLKKKTYAYDISGVITNEELAFLISQKYIVLKRGILNSSYKDKGPRFDAENFMPKMVIWTH